MAIAVDINDRLVITLKSDAELPPEQKTRFFIRPMSMGRLRKFHRKFKDANKAGFTLDDVVDQLTDLMVGWDNFRNAEGVIIPFIANPDGTAAEDNWNHLSLNQITELFDAVIDSQGLARATLKNSESGH